MLPTIVLWCYCALVASAALMGSRLPYFFKLTHRRMQFLMSFVGGLMLGVALLHMIPHAVHATGSVDRCLAFTLLGVLAMFLMIRVFHVHHHAHETTDEVAAEYTTGHEDVVLPQITPPKPVPHDHTHCGHSHAHPALPVGSSLGWLGLAVGLALHTLIDGLALGAAVQADAAHDHGGGWVLFGIGTFLAVALHKPLDSLSITTMMMASGWSRRSQNIAAIAFALMCPLGALLFALGISQFVDQQTQIVGSALAFSGGVFLCIALGDLLPEVTFHSHDRLLLTVALIAGIAIAYGIGFIESPHLHHDHDHSGHSHSHSSVPALARPHLPTASS